MASITAIVNSGQRIWWAVWQKVATKARGRTPIQKADNPAATRMPVPVADSQLNRNSAFSGTPRDGTTGTSRNTCWCRYGTAVVKTVKPGRLSKAFFTCGSPQTNTQTLSSTHGTHAETISRVVCSLGAGAE